jgi:hypothetical protein
MSTKLDIHSQYLAVRGLSPVVETGNNTLVSEIIDLQGCDGVEFILALGTCSDAGGTTIDLQIFHGDASSMSDEGSAISDANLLYGSATQLTEVTGDNAVQQLGYRGNKRYVRAKVAIAGNSGNIPASIVVIKKLKKVGSTL